MAVFRQLTASLHCRYLLKKTGRENQQNSVLVVSVHAVVWNSDSFIHNYVIF